jgi:hypothetical protein
MSNLNHSIRQALVTLRVPRKVAELILYANNIVQRMTNNPNFSSPSPTIAALTAAINDLHKAQTAALARVKGAAAARNDKRTALVSLLRALRGYVQTVADATPENGAAIIESAGLAVRKVNARAKRSFSAKPGHLSGSALVTAVTAGPRSSYEWQYSTDGGKTWG